GVTAAGHVGAAGRGSPGGPMGDSGVGEPVPRASLVVVAVVGAGASIGPLGRDAELVRLPVVLVMADLPGQVADAGRVLVVGPVLDVQIALAGAGAVESTGLGRSRGPRAAVDHVHEGRDGLAA